MYLCIYLQSVCINIQTIWICRAENNCSKQKPLSVVMTSNGKHFLKQMYVHTIHTCVLHIYICELIAIYKVQRVGILMHSITMPKSQTIFINVCTYTYVCVWAFVRVFYNIDTYLYVCYVYTCIYMQVHFKNFKYVCTFFLT